MARHQADGRKRFIFEISKFLLGWLLVVAAVFFVGKLVVDYLPALAERVSPTTTSTPVVVAPTTIAPTATTQPIVVVTTTIPATTTTTSTTTTTTIPTPDAPETVTVLVLNSTNRTGLAASATADISALGYLTEEPTNITPQRTTLEIYYAEGRELEAIALSDAFGEATLFLDTDDIVPDGVDLVVVLGSDYER